MADAEPSTGTDAGSDALDMLDALVPGLGHALVDLLDAVHDRTDDLGPAGPEVLGRLAARLTAAWPATLPAEQPLALVDALRAVLKPSAR